MNTYTAKNPYGPREDTDFKQKWGIHAVDLANQEGVTADAIHMRVKNYGTPWQRKSQPSILEIMYGKTIVQIAEEQNIHPLTIHTRLRKYGCAYHTGENNRGAWNKGKGDSDWRNDPRYAKIRTWLHPNHPDYNNWRHAYIQKIWRKNCE